MKTNLILAGAVLVGSLAQPVSVQAGLPPQDRQQGAAAQMEAQSGIRQTSAWNSVEGSSFVAPAPVSQEDTGTAAPAQEQEEPTPPDETGEEGRTTAGASVA